MPPKHGDGEEKRDRERNRDRMREKKREFTITTVPCEEIVKLGLWLNRAMDKNYFLFCSFFEKSANLNFCKNSVFYIAYTIQSKKTSFKTKFQYSQRTVSPDSSFNKRS